MLKRALVLTAIEETWFFDKPILFLGEWCKLYNNKKNWSKLNSETLDYHWNNKAKVEADYEYLKNLFERLIKAYSKNLNMIHKVDHSIHYWRIVLGPWLYIFITHVFDRYENIEIATKKYNLEHLKSIKIKNFKASLNMEEFMWLPEDDVWNQMLMTEIIKISFKKLKISFVKDQELPNINLTKKRTFIKRLILNLISIFSRTNKIFLYQTYMNTKDIVLVHLKNLQFPNIYKVIKNIEIKPQKIDRQKLLLKYEYKNKFEKTLLKLIPNHIPQSYIENYKSYIIQKNNSDWPEKPKLIITSTSHFYDDFFKIWVAEKINQDVKYCIFQHGGLYGQGLVNFSEYHEIKSSNYYLSWGWKNKDFKNIVPVGYIKKPIKKTKKPNDKILFVITNAPRYTQAIESHPLSSNWLNYFEDQIIFLENLPDHIFKRLEIKLYPIDYGWEVRKRLKARFPNIKIANNNKSFDEHAKEVKIVISGWNGTIFLESMISNIPTLIFWNKNLFIMNRSALKWFDVLKKAGIFFDNPKEASLQFAKIETNIGLWWNKRDVIEAKSKFLSFYAKKTDLVNSLTKFISSNIRT